MNTTKYKRVNILEIRNEFFDCDLLRIEVEIDENNCLIADLNPDEARELIEHIEAALKKRPVEWIN